MALNQGDKRVFQLQFSPISMIKFLVLGLAAVFIFAGAAEAKPSDKCSAEGQKPCPAWYSGPVCDPGLGTFSGKCRKCGKHGQRQCPAIERGRQCQKGLKQISGKCYRSCGGNGEIACPKIYLGYPCKGATEPDSRNICRACGGNGQKACRALKSGEQCNARLDKDSKGVCRPCGGNGEMACSTIKKGTICAAGLGKFSGVCRPCGQRGQRACPAVEQGRQCEAWTTQRDGICKPCGTENARACRVTDRGKPCQNGLKRKLNGMCVISVEEATRRAAMAQLESTGAGTYVSAFNFTQDVNDNDALTGSLEDEDASAISADEAQAACGVDEKNTGKKSQTWTVSVGASLKAIVGVEGEAGVAMPCDRETDGNLFNFENDEKLFKWFASSAFSLQLAAGGEGAVTVGWWLSEMDEIRGKSHGWTVDLTDLSGPAGKLKDIEIKGVGVSASITWWFARRDEDGDGKDDEVGEYQGFTISIASGKTAGLGSGYRAATTSQVCTYDMGCTLHEWVGEGETIVVTARNKERIRVDMNGDTGIKFVRDTWLDKRDYKRLNRKGDVVERICFRNNFTKLFYRVGSGDCDDGKELRIKSNSGTRANSVRSVSTDRRPVARPPATDQIDRPTTAWLGNWVSRSEPNGRAYRILKHQPSRYILLKLPENNRIIRFNETSTLRPKWENSSYGVIQSIGKNKLVWSRKDRTGSEMIVLERRD